MCFTRTCVVFDSGCRTRSGSCPTACPLFRERMDLAALCRNLVRVASYLHPNHDLKLHFRVLEPTLHPPPRMTTKTASLHTVRVQSPNSKLSGFRETNATSHELLAPFQRHNHQESGEPGFTSPCIFRPRISIPRRLSPPVAFRPCFMPEPLIGFKEASYPFF